MLGVAAFCVTQWDNIQAVIVGVNHNQEEIGQMQTDAKESLVDKLGIDLDAVEKLAEQITPDGELLPETNTGSSSDDATESPSTSKPNSEKGQTHQPGGKPTTSTNAVPEVSHDSADIELLLARFYAMQSAYVGKLEGIRSNAIAEYKALPKEERGMNAKMRIGKKAFSEAVALEAECDKMFTALLKELRSALSKAGIDQALANEIRNYYASEKSLLKAQLMSKYKKYLS